MPAPETARESAPKPAAPRRRLRFTPIAHVIRIARIAAPALAVALVAACSNPSPAHECTLVGTAPGITLEIRDPLASQVADAQARVCRNGACRDTSVRLMPSTGVGATTCSGDICAAAATPRPARHGFLALQDATETPVQLTLTLRDASGAQLAAHTVTVTPKATYPNGRDCAPGSPQAAVLVTPEGITVQ
ncbi:MAG: hypothetical protein HOV68_20825 [Streptomycetaceae bacterium]|nr:hypothetical protein [Streptomycetaceae bacterium]